MATIDDRKEKQLEVKESMIRKMTRLAIQYDAVNLSQGFPNEAPPPNGVSSLICGILGGTDDKQKDIAQKPIREFLSSQEEDINMTLSQFLHKICANNSLDYASQYSVPWGRQSLRQLIAQYYADFYEGDVDPDKNLTVTLGATEALAIVLRTICRPGESILVMEPYHELYPYQAAVFYLNSEFTELRENTSTKKWEIDFADLEAKASKCRAMILCDPHNPTGKVFEIEELQKIVRLCIKHDMYLITDDIYEHMIYPGATRDKHILPGWDVENVMTEAAGFSNKDVEKMASLYIIMNSVSKTWSCTGWRLGWVVSPEHLTKDLRGVHDQMVMQAATPVQIGCESLLQLPKTYYKEMCAKYRDRRDYLITELEKLGFEFTWPNSAYYAFGRFRNVRALQKFEKPIDAVMFMLLEIGVAGVPGDNFYHCGHNTAYIRFCFCRQMPELEKAIQKMQKLKEYDAETAFIKFKSLPQLIKT